MMQRRLLLGAALAAPAIAHAQPAFPNRPIRMVIPFPPAGTTDIAGRIISERLSVRLGQPVTPENRAGATGNIGAEFVARAEPDGYTLLTCTISTASINYSLFGARKTTRPEDLAAVGLLMRVPNLIFCHPSLPARNVAELVALARREPGRINYGSSGSGGSPHMTMEMFKLRTQTDIAHVPFRGAGPMMVEVIAGRVQTGCDNLPSVIGHVRDGRLRPLAVSSTTRSPALPDVPTLEEAGVRDFEATAWFGVQAPARTPRPIIERLGAEMDAIVKEPAMQSRLAELGADLPRLTPDGGTSPAAFEAFIRAEIAKWAEVVRVSGATVD